jgi:hypothetical protein
MAQGPPYASVYTTMSKHPILSLPVVCLETANHDLTLGDVVEGYTTVIGTKGHRCLHFSTSALGLGFDDDL